MASRCMSLALYFTRRALVAVRVRVSRRQFGYGQVPVPRRSCYSAVVVLGCNAFAIVLTTATMTLSGNHFRAEAKSPGETHCYKKVCHRVKTIAETRSLVGRTSKVLTTYYGHPSVDRFNAGKFTSSGELFDAGDPTRASSSNLPDGTELLVRNPENDRAIHVRINDFGPFHTQRELDLTRAGAFALGFLEQGVTTLEVTVVAPPPEGEPRYRRNRRYPPALGYVGTLNKLEVGRLVRLLIHDRSARWLTNPEILEFVRSERSLRDADLLPVASVYQASLDFPTLRAVASTTTYAAETLPQPLTFAKRRRPPTARRFSRPPIPQPNSARLGTRKIKLAAADALGWRGRQKKNGFGDRPATRWHAPPVVVGSAVSGLVTESGFLQQPALRYARLARPAPNSFEVPAFDSRSIRMTVPGLHTFMGLMAPHWGREVTPPKALGALTTVAFLLLILTWVTLEFSSMQPLYAKPLRRAPAFPRPTPSPAPAGVDLRGACASDTVAPVMSEGDGLEPPAMIPPGVKVEGVVVAARPLLIAGQLTGECHCESLVVGRQGAVEGSVQAAELAIYGQVKGTIKSNRLRIEDGANVEGDIFQKTIHIEPHAQVCATIRKLADADD